MMFKVFPILDELVEVEAQGELSDMAQTVEIPPQLRGDPELGLDGHNVVPDDA